MRSGTFMLAGLLVAGAAAAPHAREDASSSATAPLTLRSVLVTVDGTSNIHDYTASTSTVQVTALEIRGQSSGDLLAQVLQPGGLTAFDIVIPAASLTSSKDGIDKNMHKALKVREHPDIRFRLQGLEADGDAYRATGLLTIAGVEREIVLNLHVQRKASTLAVTATTDLLMTDYGIKPPKAMLGMLRTNPKVQIRIELELGAEQAART